MVRDLPQIGNQSLADRGLTLGKRVAAVRAIWDLWWHADNQAVAGHLDTDLCPLCSRNPGTQAHIICECPNIADVQNCYLQGCRVICVLYTKGLQQTFAIKMIDMATSWLPIEERGLLWTGMHSPNLQQALHETSRTLKQNKWERTIYTISSQLAEATREIWRLYHTRLREIDPVMVPAMTQMDSDWPMDTATPPTQDPAEDSLDDDYIGHKRDRKGDYLLTANELDLGSSNDPVCMSFCICVNSQTIRRLVIDEMLLTAICHCSSSYTELRVVRGLRPLRSPINFGRRVDVCCDELANLAL